MVTLNGLARPLIYLRLIASLVSLRTLDGYHTLPFMILLQRPQKFIPCVHYLLVPVDLCIRFSE